MSELPKRYSPDTIEKKWYDVWMHNNYFTSTPSDRPPFTMVIPPPNITGVLHMGHGLNNTIQDILIRWRRMCGDEVCWLPGTDHAGIATQNVVERWLKKEHHKTRDDVGREQFLRYVVEWKEKHGSTILEQLKRMGCSCDWSRTRFTMDEGLSRAVREVFVRLYKKGLIYRGNYIINWCPRCGTALADEEAEPKETQGSLWHIHYPMEDGSPGVTVATTRPETMLGDTGVAVHPDDKRYTALIGKKVQLPLTGRLIPIVADEAVDREFGTGAVKVTPAHDPADFEIGMRAGLETLNIMNPDATMNDITPAEYRGLDRFAARTKIIADLEASEFLIKTEKHTHNVPYCYRCNSVVEPYLSTQWFVRMKPLAEPAITVVKNETITFSPPRWTKVYLNWMENIRDWCISRQIWWGHQIPVWYCSDCEQMTVAVTTPETCEHCGSKNIQQDSDVLDTWFSSWLWPFSTFGWPDSNTDMSFYYPGSVLSTDSGILFFWVARMIMAGLEFTGDIPFSRVIIHGTVLDGKGHKMSKSKGNGINPLEVIDAVGADALRYTMARLASPGHNPRLAFNPHEQKDVTKNSFLNGKHFANKIYNSARYVLMNYNNEKLKPVSEINMDIADRWIISSFYETAARCDTELKAFRLNDYTQTVYDFLWHTYCDWYLEISKTSLYNGTAERRCDVLSILFHVLEGTMRLLHPVMPFITEEIWQRLPNKQGDSIMIAPFPHYDAAMIDRDAMSAFALIEQVISAIRNIRSTMNIPPDKEITAYFIGREDELHLLKSVQSYVAALAKITVFQFGKDAPAQSASAVAGGVEVYLPLEGLIDFDVERKRLNNEIDKIEKELVKTEKKLSNDNFISRANPDVVEKERTKKDEYSSIITVLKKNLAAIS